MGKTLWGEFAYLGKAEPKLRALEFRRLWNDFSRRKCWEKGRGHEPKMDVHLPGTIPVAFIFPGHVTRKIESKLVGSPNSVLVNCEARHCMCRPPLDPSLLLLWHLRARETNTNMLRFGLLVVS